MQSEINALERYTRGFNIRIMGMTEHEDEDCVASVQNLLHDSFDITEPVIENAHRVGSTRVGKPRQIIPVSIAVPPAVTSWPKHARDSRTPNTA